MTRRKPMTDSLKETKARIRRFLKRHPSAGIDYRALIEHLNTLIHDEEDYMTWFLAILDHFGIGDLLDQAESDWADRVAANLMALGYLLPAPVTNEVERRLFERYGRVCFQGNDWGEYPCWAWYRRNPFARTSAT